MANEATAKAVVPSPAVAREVKATVRENEEILIVNEEVMKMVSSAFDIQDDIENESKFVRSFIFSATNSYLKAYCAKQIAQWDRLVDQASKLHPTSTREQVATELLVSKKAKQLFDFANKAKELKKQLV